MTDFPNLVNKIASDINITREMIVDLQDLPIVSIFGSARIKEGHKFYQMTYDLAGELAKAGFAVCTGGGPGLMEAGSQGAYHAGGITLGLSIKLPFESKSNDYLTKNIVFQNFAQRKIVFCAVSSAYIAVPGGYGSMDELFEILTLMQCKIIPEAPVILMDTMFWQPLMTFIQERMLEEGLINQSDVERLFITDSIEDAVNLIKNVI